MLLQLLHEHLFSILLMGIKNTNYKFTVMDVGANRWIYDKRLFSNTKFYKWLQAKELHVPKPDYIPQNNKIPLFLLQTMCFLLQTILTNPYA